MNKKTFFKHCRYACLLLAFVSTPLLAFSSAPEAYTPANWAESHSATNDAKHAIDNDDSRLLGFAGRGFNIPGVNNEYVEALIKKCGVRYFEEFSDVIRDRSEIQQRQKASAYAVEYNQLILGACRL